MYFKLPMIREDVFIWLNDIESRLQILESNDLDEDDDIEQSKSNGKKGASSKGTSAELRAAINQLIWNYFPKLVDMDPAQSIKLVE